MTDHLPFDPECPFCGWPHPMKDPSAALVCRSCEKLLWWVYDTENIVFRLVPLKSDPSNETLVRYHHPKAQEFIGIIDKMLAEIREKREQRRKEPQND